MKMILMLCIVPGILAAASFSDDFESYIPPIDLGNSVSWLHLPGTGNLLVTEESGNNIVETVWNGYNAFAYLCLGSVTWLDGEISSDVRFNGDSLIIGLASRLDVSTGEGYLGGIYPLFIPFGATVIAQIDSNGNYTILTSDLFFPMEEDTWYNISFQVTGTDPVNLQLSIDGTVNSSCTDYTYLIGEGLSGLGGSFESSEPVLCYDNFSVVDYASALTSGTFGEIKAIFR
ncbi:MAG: hypothetical protein ABFR50_04100 [Candidatus Fermentibacteria bacterium]